MVFHANIMCWLTNLPELRFIFMYTNPLSIQNKGWWGKTITYTWERAGERYIGNNVSTITFNIWKIHLQSIHFQVQNTFGMNVVFKSNIAKQGVIAVTSSSPKLVSASVVLPDHPESFRIPRVILSITYIVHQFSIQTGSLLLLKV